MELRCVVVNSGRVLVVTMSEDKSASDLQDAIKSMLGPKAPCIAHRLKLYMTKTTDDESWLRISPEDVDDMAKGKIPETIQAFMTSKYAIPEGAYLSRSPLAKAEHPWNEAHVLVQVPEIEWQYQPEPNPVYALDMDELYFVDPDQAVEQLQSIHEEMYRASKEFDSCRSLPVADHALGMGKTTFAHHYVRLCLKTWPIQATRTDFQQTICAAHTVMCRLESGVFVHEVSAQVTMNDLLAKAVRRHLSPETELSVLTPPLSTSPQTFAEDLVAAIGPLFIVLDNVGDAFGDGNLDEKTSRDRFAQFCKDVLLSWTQVPGLVFVVLGHAPFLRFFKSMNSSLNAKPWYLECLPLFCLEPPQVQRILRHTLHKAALPETLVDRWGLTSLELEEDATSVLFDLSGGHPGTIMRFLRDYTTYESFKLYAIGDNWLDFYRDAWRWRGILQDWIVTFRLPRGNTRIIDLSRAEMLEDDKWVDISYGEVMRHCHLLWEGALIEASVFAHPVVEDVIMNVVLPLNLYALRVCEMAPRRTLSYAMAFQWMCVKRLQELFDQLLVPRVASPLFFGETTVWSCQVRWIACQKKCVTGGIRSVGHD